MPGMHDVVLLADKTFFGDYDTREGRVVAVTEAAVVAEFPNSDGLEPMRVSMTPESARAGMLIVRRAAADELDQAKADVAELRARLADIGQMASVTAGLAAAGQVKVALQRIARLARQA